DRPGFRGPRTSAHCAGMGMIFRFLSSGSRFLPESHFAHRSRYAANGSSLPHASLSGKARSGSTWTSSNSGTFDDTRRDDMDAILSRRAPRVCPPSGPARRRWFVEALEPFEEETPPPATEHIARRSEGGSVRLVVMAG